MAFSIEEFERWALADLGRAGPTVYYYKGRLQACRRLGFDVEIFLSSPEAALVERRRFVANLKLDPMKPASAHTLRGYDRVINWLSLYAQASDSTRQWPRFKLTKEPRATPKTVRRSDMERLWAYGDDDCLDHRLVRVIAWVAYWVGGRRGEVALLWLEDMKAATSEVYTRHVGKNGIRHDVQVPRMFFAPKNPWMQWLKVRPHVEGRQEVFTKIHGNTGKPIVVRPSMAYTLLKAAGDELGVRVNFTRTRRSISQYEDSYNVPRSIIQYQRGQVKGETTEIYLNRKTNVEARQQLVRSGMPEYQDEAAEVRQA